MNRLSGLEELSLNCNGFEVVGTRKSMLSFMGNLMNVIMKFEM